MKKILLRAHDFLSLLWRWICFPFKVIMVFFCYVYMFVFKVYKWFFIIGGMIYIFLIFGSFFIGIFSSIVEGILKRFHFG